MFVRSTHCCHYNTAADANKTEVHCSQAISFFGDSAPTALHYLDTHVVCLTFLHWLQWTQPELRNNLSKLRQRSLPNSSYLPWFDVKVLDLLVCTINASWLLQVYLLSCCCTLLATANEHRLELFFFKDMLTIFVLFLSLTKRVI